MIESDIRYEKRQVRALRRALRQEKAKMQKLRRLVDTRAKLAQELERIRLANASDESYYTTINRAGFINGSGREGYFDPCGETTLAQS